MNNSILRNALVTFASFIFVITIVSAWTAPTQTAPNGNVPAPVTIGADQIKSGALGVAALVSLGGVQIGTTTALCTSGPLGTAGTVRWYKGAMEYCNGTAWVPFGGGGGASPYCAYSGQTKEVSSPNYNTLGGVKCSMSVDALGFQTISVTTKMMTWAFVRCSDLKNNQDVAACSFTNWQADSVIGNDIYKASFDRSTGVLTCTSGVDYAPPQNGYTNYGTYTTSFTKDESKCVSGGGGGGTETDPTVLTSVKDGVSWSEVTNKPTQMSGSVVAGCMMGGSPCWGGASVGGDTSFGGGYLLCPTGTTAYTISPANGTGLCIKN